MDWKKHFESQILERGYDYYNFDAVDILKVTNRSIDANVMGSNPYLLRINIKNDNIESMYCDCPYEGNCKHLAAVLYYAEEHPEIFSKNDEDIKSIVDNTSCEDLKDFIINELSNDDNLLNRFKLFSNQSVDETYYINKLKISFSSPINVINFMDEDLNILIQNRNYNLVLKLCEIIIDYLEDLSYNHEWDSFDNILDKIDSIMIRLLESDCESDALAFLENVILTNDNIYILDLLTDTYSRYGDVEKLFEENCTKL